MSRQDFAANGKAREQAPEVDHALSDARSTDTVPRRGTPRLVAFAGDDEGRPSGGSDDPVVEGIGADESIFISAGVASPSAGVPAMPPTARLTSMYIGLCMSAGVAARATSTLSKYQTSVVLGPQHAVGVEAAGDRRRRAWRTTTVWLPVGFECAGHARACSGPADISMTSSSGGQEPSAGSSQKAGQTPLSLRHVGAHLEIAVGLREGLIRRQQARRVFVVIDVRADSRVGARAAVIVSTPSSMPNGLTDFVGRVVGVDVPLQFACCW